MGNMADILQTTFSNVFRCKKTSSSRDQIQCIVAGPSRCHDMETISVLLALCEGIPLVTDGFSSQRASNASFVWFGFSLNIG